ncbi:MAG: hypothetical protein AAF432_05660 [Planctomycetota bacterium]
MQQTMPQHAAARDNDSGYDMFFMIVSAVLFAYFGFYLNLQTTNSSGQTVPLWVYFAWLMRGACIGFVIAIVLKFIAGALGDLVYFIMGILCGVGLLVLGIWDVRDTTYIAPLVPFWAFVFAAWNLWGSVAGLRAIMARRRRTPARDRSVHEMYDG